jgi:hypothetical protein
MSERRGQAGLLLMSLLLPAWGTGLAQNRPLASESPETVEKDKLRLEAGFDFLQNVRFPLSGLEGDLTRLGSLGVRWGAGERVEIQLFWTAVQVLNVDERFIGPNTPILDFEGNSTSDVGNLVLGTKLRFADEAEGRPALGFRFAVELPNTTSESGLGTDETNFHSGILLSKHLGDLEVIANAGLSILGDPVSGGAQDDLFSYGLALVHPMSPSVSLVADWNGRAGAGGFGTEEQSVVRFGFRTETSSLVWDAGILFGFETADPETGLFFGLSKDFNLGD